MNILNKYSRIIILILIILLAIILRFYKLGEIPPSLSWDETAVGYNAYTIANWGQDEWGKTLPAYFISFEDDKNPVHIYLTAISVRIFGLSEFSVRFPFALFGVFNVILIFFIAKRLFTDNNIALSAAFIMAISPYALQFSRFNHEATITLFFFMAGLLIFLIAIKNHPRYLFISLLSFWLTILSYHSAKIIVPLIMVILFIIYFKELSKMKSYFFLSLIGFSLLMTIFLFNPALLGTARMKQSSIPIEAIYATNLFQKTNNELLGRVELSWNRYLSYFSPDYLFLTGDKIARHSTGVVGEFYKIDLLFLLIGLIVLIFKKSKSSIIIICWALLAPLPASISGGVTETAHAARALFMMGSWHLIIAVGFIFMINLIHNKIFKIIIFAMIMFFLISSAWDYLRYYHTEYSQKDAVEWQYGMKEIVQYLKEKNGYFRVYVTNERSQPYIFFLFYLQTRLSEFLKTVEYNDDAKRPSNLVYSFNKYFFGGWEPRESMPNPGFLYVLTPSEYDGLRHKTTFDIKKIIKYPNGNDAFFLVSYP